MFRTSYSYRRNILVINLKTRYIYNVESWQYSHLSFLIYSPSMMNETYSTLFDHVDIRFLIFYDRFMTTDT